MLNEEWKKRKENGRMRKEEVKMLQQTNKNNNTNKMNKRKTKKQRIKMLQQ